MSVFDMSREPSHPGEVLFSVFFPKLGISQSKFAELLKVREQTIIDLKKKRRGLSSLMALKLGKLFGTSPDVWIGLQEQYDLWHTYQEKKEEVDGIEKLEVA